MIFTQPTITIYFLQLLWQVRSRERIIKGEECQYEEYPFAVAFFCNGLCGGVLISLQWVLTAAHCVSFTVIKSGRAVLRTGFNYDRNLVQKRFAKKAVCHDKFYEMAENVDLEIRYDIALILANKPFEGNHYVRPVLLPPPGFASKCSRATAVGTGMTEPYGSRRRDKEQKQLNATLNCAELPIVDIETCKRQWEGSIIDSSIVCTGVEDGRDPCHGDSGGGLYCNGRVIGIVSWGQGCSVPNTTTTCTNVEAYLDFIMENTLKHDGAGAMVRGWVNLVAIAVVLKILVY